MLHVKIGRIVRKLGIKSPFRNGVPVKDWIAGFLKRHLDVSHSTPQALSTCRARMLNATVTNNYFNDLARLLESLSLQDKPVRIWNIDETSVPLLHKPARVLGPSCAKIFLEGLGITGKTSLSWPVLTLLEARSPLWLL
ncbi:hypothetical protein DPMN_153249 [Dreissena polymorpha]|uniref:Uncharacterized protein n=1 Tax=Dreissena polymorpha TaxID=45954 RepID=A0A9D4J8R0_DREPO|nr:hypothetical protein DPMN_153249 [Dreissena polymorpha]